MSPVLPTSFRNLFRCAVTALAAVLLSVPALSAYAAGAGHAADPVDSVGSAAGSSVGSDVCGILGGSGLEQKIASTAFDDAAKYATQKIVTALFKVAEEDAKVWGQLAEDATKDFVGLFCPDPPHKTAAQKLAPYFTVLNGDQSAAPATGTPSVPSISVIGSLFQSTEPDPGGFAAATLNTAEGTPNRFTGQSIQQFTGDACQDLAGFGYVSNAHLRALFGSADLSAMPAVNEIVSMALSSPSCSLTDLEANSLVRGLTSYLSANQAAEEALPPVVQSFIWECPTLGPVAGSDISLIWQGLPAPRISGFDLWVQVDNGLWQPVDLATLQSHSDSPGQLTVPVPIGNPQSRYLFAARVVDQDQHDSGWSFLSPNLSACTTP